MDQIKSLELYIEAERLKIATARTSIASLNESIEACERKILWLKEGIKKLKKDQRKNNLRVIS